MKYQEYKTANYPELAKNILKYWEEEKIFEKAISEREGRPTFTFYEGPPSANGTPGIHHVMARAIKDLFCRYKTQKGYQVKRKGGWDTHGLPVELQVEKELGITKEDIGKKISVEAYNQKCRETVMKFKDEWDQLTKEMGYWVDLEHPYVTFDKDYMETLWWVLKQLYDKDLIYKGYTIQPYSPAAGTGLSSHELNQPGCYRDIKDTSVTAQFKIKGKEDEYFLAWTTTPWTLPSNSALAVGEKLDYVKVATFNPYTFKPVKVILAKARMTSYFNPKAESMALEEYAPGGPLIPYKIIEEFKGKDLLGMTYEQLMPFVPLESPAFTVISGDFVTTEDGTGIVHMAKAFGSDDYRTLEQQGIPGIFVTDDQGNNVPVVDKKGKFIPVVGQYLVEKMAAYAITAHKEYDADSFFVKNYLDEDESVKNYKSTDIIISIILKEENKAFKVEKYEHSYPHCWRTDKPVLYYPLDSWFIRTTAFKDELVALNNTINWKPASTGTGRFGNWLENLVDWNLSRSRFWGTPLPIWVSKDGTEIKCIGSIREFEAEIEKAIAAGLMEKSPYEDKEIDLHKPYVDAVVLVSDTGTPMYREPDLVDVWFDSGAMPYAQWHFPFENKDIFEDNFPADFIAEGVDQTRGWFFTLHALATMLYGKVAFKNVIANGLVLDKDGNKMSKRLGNAVDPFKSIKDYGPDALRWYMISNANPWDNLKFNIGGVEEVQRRFFGTLHNTYAFFALYANLDGFDYSQAEVADQHLTELDRWVRSRLNTLIKSVDAAYAEYEPTRAARMIQDFTIDDLSNWYVRLNRKRFWQPGGVAGDAAVQMDKTAAYQTLYQCLEQIARLIAPIAPFYAEHLFRDLNLVTKKEASPSVHLAEFPSPNESRIDTDLEDRMRMAQNISSLVHSLRKKHRIKVRQPLSKILIPVPNNKFESQLKAVEEVFLSEVNVKAVSYLKDEEGSVIVKKIKPDFKKLGARYGALLKELSGPIVNLKKDDIKSLESGNTIDIKTSQGLIPIELDDVEISYDDIPGWSVAREEKVTVALDITLTDALKNEGIARDLVNRVQNLRKDMGLDVQDKIRISIQKNGHTPVEAIENHKDYICKETQAHELKFVDQLAGGTEFEIEAYKLLVKLEL